MKVIIAQVPRFGAEPPELNPSTANLNIIKEILLRGDVHGSPETTIVPMPVVSFDQVGTPSLLKPIQTFRWFIDYGGRAGSRWINNVTRVLPDKAVPYNPVLCAPFIRAHTLLMVAPDDEMVHANYSVAKQAYALIPGPKLWYDIDGGHFGLLFYPSELFNKASRLQPEFLKQWL